MMPPRTHHHWARFALVVALVLLAGCGKKPPTAPTAKLGPQIAQVFPPARSFHVLYNTAIWVEFSSALDPATVNTSNVFLKVDTRRLPITVSWDAARKRITIVPAALLALVRTHTVELSANLRTADGTPLGETFFWQFTTMGIRPPLALLPADRATGESPVVTLSWLGTDPTAGAISYDLYLGTDSAAVAAHAVPRLARTSSPLYRPSRRWSQDQPLYWTVVAFNATSAESLAGGVWRFDMLSASTPIDTVLTTASDWFTGSFSSRGTSYIRSCNGGTIESGLGLDNLIRFGFAGLSPSLRLAGAALELPAYFGYTADPAYYAAMGWVGNVWNICVTSVPPFIPPQFSGLLAQGEVIPGNRFRFSSDLLAVHVEATVRLGGNRAYTFQSAGRFAYAAYPPPAMKLYVYRPAAPAMAAARP